jgi:hypothetical protein
MGSSFENLDTRNPTMKMILNLDTLFKGENILNKRTY